MARNKEILVYGTSHELVDDFIRAFEKNISYSFHKIRLNYLVTTKTKGFVFLYDDQASYDSIIQKSSVVTLPKCIVRVLTDNPETIQENSQIDEKKRSSYSVNLSSPSSIEEIILKLSQLVETGYKLLNLQINHRGMRVIKWSSFVCSLLSALQALILIFMAGIIAITRSSEDRRWFANSLLTAGNLTFVMSFVGFYGVKKTGIKEYLKIYSGVLITNALYKTVLMIIYTQMNWQPNVHEMIIPVLCSCIGFEMLTSWIILLELNIVKTSVSDARI